MQFIFVTVPLDDSPDNLRLLETPRYEQLLLVTFACHVQLQREANTHDMPAELESHSCSAFRPTFKAPHCVSGTRPCIFCREFNQSRIEINNEYPNTVITPVHCLLHINNIRAQRQGLSRREDSVMQHHCGWQWWGNPHREPSSFD